jgi:hypothetical protein
VALHPTLPLVAREVNYCVEVSRYGEGRRVEKRVLEVPFD